MTTINISLPEKLKNEAQSFVDKGYYSSFSDLVRDALRKLVAKDKYTILADEAIEDLKKGKGTLLKSTKEIDDFFDSI